MPWLGFYASLRVCSCNLVYLEVPRSLHPKVLVHCCYCYVLEHLESKELVYLETRTPLHRARHPGDCSWYPALVPKNSWWKCSSNLLMGELHRQLTLISLAASSLSTSLPKTLYATNLASIKCSDRLLACPSSHKKMSQVDCEQTFFLAWQNRCYFTPYILYKSRQLNCSWLLQLRSRLQTRAYTHKHTFSLT